MNIGRKGVTSFSIGGRGATLNLSKSGTKTTYNLPGTGISYQTRTSPWQAATRPVNAVSQGAQAPRLRTQSKPWKPFVLVGIAATIVYFVLRPSDIQQQHVPGERPHAVTPTVATLAPQFSMPAVIPSANAAVSSELQPRGAHADDSVRREVTTITGANVRSSPSISATIVKVLGIGATLRVVEVNGSWNRVLDADGNPLGWVHQSIVR